MLSKHKKIVALLTLTLLIATILSEAENPETGQKGFFAAKTLSVSDWYKKTHLESHINRSKLINSLLKYIVEKRDKVVLERVYRDYIHLRDRLGYIRGFYSFFSYKKEKTGCSLCGSGR